MTGGPPLTQENTDTYLSGGVLNIYVERKTTISYSILLSK